MTNEELIKKIRRKVKELQDEFISIQPKDCSLKLIKSYAGYAYLDKVLSFIDSLESEKPMNLDLEIEIEDYVEQRWQFAEVLNAAVPIYLYDMTLNELKDCARHFYELGKQNTIEELLHDRPKDPRMDD